MTPIDREIVERFLDAIRNDRGAEAAALLEAHAGLERADVFAAAGAGNVDALDGLLARDPSLAVATHGTEEWPPLAYVCRSPLHATTPDRAAGLRRAAARLLEAGASPNSFSAYWESDAKKVPISVLYHACMSDHRELVEWLLERGAATQDGESIYHAAQHDRRACLELLLEHGADLSSAQSPYGNTPLYFLVGHHDDANGRAPWFQGLVWLLEHGADPNVPSYTSAETPLHALAAGAPKPATALALLAHGADINARRLDGRTPYQIAVRRGNETIASILRDHGADTTGLSPADEFFGACLAGDEARVRALLAQRPDLHATIAADGATVLGDAVRQDRADAIRLMVDVGFEPGPRDPGGATPLHWAAWLGRIDAVRQLTRLGAPLDLRDWHYGSTPLGWAAHGSTCHADDDRYCAIVDLLIDAGAEATREALSNRWGKTLDGAPAVAARLKARGVL